MPSDSVVKMLFLLIFILTMLLHYFITKLDIELVFMYSKYIYIIFFALALFMWAYEETKINNIFFHNNSSFNLAICSFMITTTYFIKYIYSRKLVKDKSTSYKHLTRTIDRRKSHNLNAIRDKFTAYMAFSLVSIPIFGITSLIYFIKNYFL